MTTNQEAINTAAFSRLHDATNSGDIELIARAIDELVAPDAVIDTPLPLKEVWTRLLPAFPDLHITVEDLIAKDDTIVCRQTVTATHQGEYMGLAPTGRPVAYDEMFILRFADGRIVEIRGVVDVFAQMRQLGAIAA
jgi:predicted ester cyclase